MFRSVILSFATVVVVAFADYAYATPTSVKLGLVDLQKVIAASESGKSAQKKYEEEVNRAKSKVEMKKKEVNTLRESYEKQKASLTEEARRKKEEEILNSEKELKRSLQDSQEKLRRENAELVSDLVKRIRQVVDKIGKEQGFTVILEKGTSFVLYADSGADITDLVIDRFNKTK